MGGVEVQMNWKLASKQQQLSNIFRSETALRTIASSNTYEEFNKQQQGGTMAMAFDQMATFVKETTTDPRGLGRWVSMKIRVTEEISTRVVVLYVPCSTERKTNTSVMAQHRRQLRYKYKDYRCPRNVIREDIKVELTKWMDQGEKIILFADANESVRDGKLNKLLSSLGLRECLSTRHKNLKETKSWFRGKRQILGVWASPSLTETSCSLLPFGFSLGDHRGILLDIPTKLLIGTNLPRIIRPVARRLQCFNPKVRFRYLRYLEQYLVFHRILQKLHGLYREDPESISQEAMDKIDNEICEGMRAAEKRCRKLCMGMVEFSPELNRLGKIWELWKLVKRLKSNPNSKINRGRIKKMAKAVEIKKPLSLSLGEVCVKCSNARKDYLEKKPLAEELRLTFLSENDKIPLLDREEEADKILSAMIKREETRAAWRCINAARGIERLSSVSQVQVTENGIEIIKKQKKEVEESIITEVSKRFRLTENWSTFRTGPLAEDVGLLAEKEAAQQIIEGNYHPSFVTGYYTREMIKHYKMPDVIKKAGPINTTLTKEDFVYHWKKAKERTSSSISGLHFGHYKAATENELISEIHALKVHLCANSGVSLTRWQKGLQVMLMKEKENYSPSKLRAILLIEADYNWMSKTLIGNRLVNRALETKQMPKENFGGVKNRCAIDLGVCRGLFWDVLRQRKCAGGICAVDATNCYDRVVHNTASLAARKWGMPAKAMLCLLMTVCTMSYALRTAFGESTSTYGGSREDPFQGLCQGNGGASGEWLCVVCIIVEFMEALGHGVSLSAPITLFIICLLALIYVDDTDLLNMEPEGRPEMERVLPSMQKAIDDWEGALITTGGALKEKKCNFQVVGFHFRDGKWSYKKPTTKPQLRIKGDDGKGYNIKYLPHDQSLEVVGLKQAPNGKHKDQIEVMVNKAKEWSKRICSSGIKRNLAWTSFNSCIWRSIAYALPAISLGEEDNNRLMRALYTNSISAMGIERSFPNEMKFTSSEFLGLDLPNGERECGVAKLLIWIRHASTATALGEWLRLSYEYTQLEVNQGGCLFDLDYNKWAFLTTDCWVKDLWKFVHKFNIKLRGPPSTYLHTQRENDKFLMKWFEEMGASKEELLALNRCRILLRIMTLADLVSGDGSSLRQEAMNPGNWRFPSNIKGWPNAKTMRSDWTTWRSYIQKSVKHNNVLKSPLGKWKQFTHSKLVWRYHPESDMLLKETGNKWLIYKKRRTTPTRIGTTFVNTKETMNACPDDAQVALVREYPNGTVRFDGSSGYGKGVTKGLVVRDDWKVELNSCWLLCHSEFIGCISRAKNVKKIRMVCDGSYQPSLDDELGAAAWTFESLCGLLKGNGATAAPGICSDSFRPELTGLLTCLVVILHLCINGNMRDAEVEIACDNDAALIVGKSANEYLHTNRPEGDVVRAIHRVAVQLQEDYNIDLIWTEVEGHVAKNKSWQEMTRVEQLNEICDISAKNYLREMVAQQLRPTQLVPFEGWEVRLRNRKVQGNIREEVNRHISRPIAKKYFIRKEKLNYRSFELVNWEAIGNALKNAPSSFKIWATKHVTGFCATTHRLHIQNKHPTGKCPSCEAAEEYPSHVIKCRHEDIKSTFSKGLKQLKKWMEAVQTDPVVINMTLKYLNERGENPFVLPPNEEDLRPVGRLVEQEFIGFDNMMMGMTAKALEKHQKYYYRAIGSNRSAKKWSSNFVFMLLKLSQKCWRKRNRLLHGNSPEYLPRDAYASLNAEVIEEINLGVTGLKRSDYKLVQKDVNTILEMRAAEKQSWLYTVQLARASQEKK